MEMVNFKKPAVYLSLLLAFAAIAPAVSLPFDQQHIPVIVTPADSSLSSNESTTVTVTMDGSVASDTVVSLSTDSSELGLPQSVTVRQGHTTASFDVSQVSFKSMASLSKSSSTIAHVTATCNGGSASAAITIE